MEYKCNICNKVYSSYNSRWLHNKKFHTNVIQKCTENVKKCTENVKKCTENIKNSIENINDKKYKCIYCLKNYSSRQNKWSHEQKCKNIIKENNKLDELKEETKQQELLLQIKKEESKILQLKIKLQNSTKIDNITLKKLNKLLMERNNKIKNTINNTINNNQQIINNFNLIGFGKEEVINLLTNQEKRLIMNSKYGSLEKLGGKYNQFKNIIITNMKDNYMYKYDDTQGCFVLSTKNDVLTSLIDYRIIDLEIIYNDLLEKNKLDEKTKDIIEKFINKINYSDSKYTDLEGKEHISYKQYKINEIKILLFNNQDKITNDICLLLTTTNEIIV